MTPDERMSDSSPPTDAAEPRLGDYSQLEGKIRRSRLRRDRMWAWGKWGALVGGLGWLLFVGILALIVGAGKAGTPRDNRLEAVLLLLGRTPIAVVFAGAAGASGGALIDLVRPIYLALFDAKQFEREYGCPRPRGQA
jgi:hypothetical protein